MDNGRKTEDAKTEAAAAAAAAQNQESADSSVEFGTWLKAKRETVRVPLEEIAAITKVHITQLRMIEENHWQTLPAPAFVRGFLLCYARHIGLDEDEVLRRYRKSLGKSDPTFLRNSANSGNTTSERPRVIASPNFKSSPAARDLDKIRPPILTPKRVLSGMVFLGILILISFLISVGKTDTKKVAVVTDLAPKTTTTETPSPTTSTVTDGKTETAAGTTVKTAPSNSLTNTAPSTAAIATSTTAIDPKKTPMGMQLAVKAIEQTWISVRIDNQESKGQLIKVGTRLTFEGKNKIDFVFSNAGAVELEFNGKKYYPPGFRGDVVKMSLPADAGKLKEKPAAPRQIIKAAPAVVAPATGAATPGATPPPAAEATAKPSTL